MSQIKLLTTKYEMNGIEGTFTTLGEYENTDETYNIKAFGEAGEETYKELYYFSTSPKGLTYANLKAMFEGIYEIGDLDYDGNDLTCTISDTDGIKAFIVTFVDPYEDNTSLEDYDLDKVTVDYIERF